MRRISQYPLAPFIFRLVSPRPRASLKSTANAAIPTPPYAEMDRHNISVGLGASCKINFSPTRFHFHSGDFQYSPDSSYAIVKYYPARRSRMKFLAVRLGVKARD